MKNLIYKIIICFFLTINLNAQIFSGHVTYTIKKNPTNLFKNKLENQEQYKNLQDNLESKIATLKFILEFNKDNSLFYLQEKLSLDNSEFYTEMAILSTRGNSIFYFDKKKQIILEEVFFLGQNFLIKSSLNELKWELTKENKKIGNYLCFKAIATRENSGPVEKENKNSTYTAWYCPELAYNFGPYEVCGLPGLVLEFSNGQMVYYASEIKLSKEKIEIKEPKKGKVISKKEFEEIGKKAFENNELIKN